MSSWWYTIDISKPGEKLSPLLPQIAGVIENVEQASFQQIKEQIEKDLEKTVSEVEVMRALENGIKLGVFQIEREYKVCREFTTKEMKKSKQNADIGKSELYDGISSKPTADVNLMNYVKNQREERRKKLHKKTKKANSSFSSKYIKGNSHLYKYLCDQCKKSVERELVDNQISGSSTEDEEGRDSASSVASSNELLNSSNSAVGIRFSGDLEKPPEKSRLLVEKNPMETDPPYCDIFT